MPRYIMSITAQDRPGIVAAVSEAILQLDGNIEAASQTVHQGYFAMIILCAFDAQTQAPELSDLVHDKAGPDLHVYVTPYQTKTNKSVIDPQSFIVTSIGPDKPGILQALSSYLASKRINIDDLYAYVDRENFVVICQASVPSDLDVFMLQADLEAVGQDRGFKVSMCHANVFVATNEL